MTTVVPGPSVGPGRLRRRTLVGVEAPAVVLELVERDDAPVVALRLRASGR